MEYGAQIKSVSDVKVDSIVKSIWSKVAITTSYHKCYHKWAGAATHTHHPLSVHPPYIHMYHAYAHKHT